MHDERYPTDRDAWLDDLPKVGHFVYWLATVPPGQTVETCELVYIGVTSSLRARLRAHSRKWWWPTIDPTLLYLEQHATRREANIAEAEQIHWFQPAMNRAGRLLVVG